MYGIVEVMKFKTTDGHTFDTREDAYKWQSCLNMNALKDKKVICGDGLLQKINDRRELEIFLNYLHFYLDFENVYADYDTLEYPINIKYDLRDGDFEIIKE